MRFIQIGAVILLITTIFGCTAATTDSSNAQSSDLPTTELPSPSPAASLVAEPAVTVAAESYRARGAAENFDGVEFGVAMTGITCGIYNPYFTEDSPTANYFGCLAPNATFEWPVVGNDGEDNFIASAISVRDSQPGSPAWISDATFSPDGAPFTTLNDAQSIAWSTVTCTVVSEGVTCTDSSTGHGFRLSNSEYETF